MSPPLGLCSPAKSLGLRVCHSFCIHVRQSLPSLQCRSLKKTFSVCFHSVQPLSNSHNKSSFVQHTNPSRSTCFPICFTPFQSFHYAPFPQPHQQPTLAVGITPHNPFHKHRSTNRKFFLPNPTPTKTCAKSLCILHRSPAVQFLPISVFHPCSTHSRLATFQSYLLSLATHTPVSQFIDIAKIPLMRLI